MKRLFALLLVAVVLCGCSKTSEAEHDFRNTDWGMSVEKVTYSETTDFNNTLKDDSTNSSTIEYKNALAVDNISLDLEYYFYNSKLVRGNYYKNYEIDSTNETNLNNLNQIVYDTASKLENYFTKIYGKPNFSTSDKIKSDNVLQYTASWENKDTQITLFIKKYSVNPNPQNINTNGYTINVAFIYKESKLWSKAI